MKILTTLLGLLLTLSIWGQRFEYGMETTYGKARTSFRGDLASMVGFEELEITDSDIDSALAFTGINAPNWLKNLFPGIRVDVDQEISRQLSRNVHMVRLYARYRWVGVSFSTSDPRLVQQSEAKRLRNQLKSARLSVQGDAEGLATHLALMAVADANRTQPFFDRRYDVEAYVHLKKIFLGEEPLMTWGRNDWGSIDLEVTPGFRLTADPSPVVDLGNVLFISEKIDSLLEGGLLNQVEDTTDELAEAIQNIVFGKFKDPRSVPSRGWFLRAAVPVSFGGGFSVVGGGEFSMNWHTQLEGTKPMTSWYAYAGIRWDVRPFTARR